MDPRSMSLLDLAIGGVPVIIFCVWQLISINRTIARDRRARAAAAEAPKPKIDLSPQGAGHAVGQHGLDDG